MAEIDDNTANNFSFLVTERDFLSLLIELYRNRPVLWKVRHKQYGDKAARARALDEIVKELQTYKPDYDVDKVKKKINIIRTNYNKQKHRLDKKRAQGNTDQVPALWYFNELLFLDEQEVTPRARRVKRCASNAVSSNNQSKELPHRNVDQDESETSSSCSSKSSAADDIETIDNSDSKPYEDQDKEGDGEDEDANPLLFEKPQKVNRYKNVRVKRRKVYKDEPNHDAVMEEKEDSDTEQYMTITTTYFKKKKMSEDILADSWAMKLKRMAAEQKMFAEKIINDVIFQGELGNLTCHGVSFNSF